MLSSMAMVTAEDAPRQSSSVELSTNPSLRQVDPGSSAIFTLTVKNLGAVQDVIDLEISTMPKNWTVMFSDTTLELDPDESDTVSLSIKPSKEALTGDSEFTVTGTSTMDATSSSVKVTVRVKQVHQLSMGLSTVGEVSAGGSTSFTVAVTNIGNGPDTVSIRIVPVGEATSWFVTVTTTMELEPGEKDVHTQSLSVPSDTEGGRYTLTVKASSSGNDADVTKDLVFQVKEAPSSGFELETWMLLMLIIIMFMVIAVLAAVYTPSRSEKKGAEATASQATQQVAGHPSLGTAPVTKVKKRRKRKLRKDDEQLGRIEKRLEELHTNHEKLHEHILQLQKNHNQSMSHFQLHLIKHHGEKGEEEVEDKEDEVVEDEAGPMEPGPVEEALPPEGPPENMSIGDEQGEIRERKEEDTPPTSAVKCPRCSGDIEKDWVRCAHCGYLL
jgi:hypothetical protein